MKTLTCLHGSSVPVLGTFTHSRQYDAFDDTFGTSEYARMMQAVVRSQAGAQSEILNYLFE